MKKRVLISLAIFVFLVLISFLLRYFGGSIADYSSDVIAIVAVNIVVWKEFLAPKLELKREYHVSPQKLIGRRLDKLKLHVIVQNTGEVPINLRFSWIDIDNGSRIEFSKLLDFTEKEVDSDVTLNSHSFKDLYIIFEMKSEDAAWHKIQADVDEATDKGDIRLLGDIVQLGGRLCWYDATKSAQEVRLPLGAMLKDFTKHKIDNPIGIVRHRE